MPSTCITRTTGESGGSSPSLQLVRLVDVGELLAVFFFGVVFFVATVFLLRS